MFVLCKSVQCWGCQCCKNQFALLTCTLQTGDKQERERCWMPPLPPRMVWNNCSCFAAIKLLQMAPPRGEGEHQQHILGKPKYSWQETRTLQSQVPKLEQEPPQGTRDEAPTKKDVAFQHLNLSSNFSILDILNNKTNCLSQKKPSNAHT